MKSKMMMMVLTTLLATGAWAAESKADVTVNGMVCSFCAQGITKKFNARPEVSNVKVKLGEQMVHLSFKEGQTFSDETIRKILTESGYSVEKVDRNPT